MVPDTFIPNTPEYRNYLAEIGLEPKWFHPIGIRVLSSYNSATPNDARTAAGSYAYLEAVKALREELFSHGWRRPEDDRKCALELVVNIETGFSLFPTSGDENTGNENAIPATRNPKGSQTAEVVDNNQRQLTFWPELDPLPEEAKRPDGIKPTWFFMYHVDPFKSEMRMEISLPIMMDREKGTIKKWKKRIILDPIPFSPEPIPPKGDYESEVEFEIKRKG